MNQSDKHHPHISIRLGQGGAAISQQRPGVLAGLAGMPVDSALALVPRLLPVCGEAQSIAAARAVAAARDLGAETDEEIEREQRLLREQAAAAAWRLALDWPAIEGEPRQMPWLKHLRDSRSDSQRAALLRSALPGLAELRTAGDLLPWCEAGECLAAKLLHRLRAAPGTARPRLLHGEELSAAARDALAHPEFDPLAPPTAPAEVGPLAMARHPLTEALAEAHAGPFARAAALLLDTLAICAALEQPRAHAGRVNSWAEGQGCGSGRAVTARGPVFHRVQLDADDRVAQWSALAPTDWHFAPAGPVAMALAQCVETQSARRVVAGFDPCVPCTVETGGA